MVLRSRHPADDVPCEWIAGQLRRNIIYRGLIIKPTHARRCQCGGDSLAGQNGGIQHEPLEARVLKCVASWFFMNLSLLSLTPCVLLALQAQDSLPVRITAVRSASPVIITPEMLPGDDGGSINGPGMIRVPDWVVHPLGRYYLYFAHHTGKYLRMAYADRVEGPWKIYQGGVLPLERQHVVSAHIASPDPIVDREAHQIVLFFHGGRNKAAAADSEAGQITSVATSTDGLHFTPIDVVVGPAYLRVFRRDGYWFAINGHGDLLRSKTIDRPFEKGARVIGPEIADLVDPVKLGEPGAKSERPETGADRYSIRHVGIDIRGNLLVVYFSCVGHRPERLLATAIDMTGRSGELEGPRSPGDSASRDRVGRHGPAAGVLERRHLASP